MFVIVLIVQEKCSRYRKVNKMASNDEIIQDLLEEFQQHRADVKKMIVDLEQLKVNISSLFPDTLDARYVRLFEEKVKTTTELFRVLLDLRKEISKTLKEEIELRRKKGVVDEDSLEEFLNIRDIVKKVEMMQKEDNVVSIASNVKD